VYGHPVKHSASPAMQNAGLGALRLNWRYLAFDVPPDDLRSAIVGAKAMKFVGLNLTVPHKLLALEMMDVLDDSAVTWGAVNTVRFETKDAMGQWVPLAAVPVEDIVEVRAHGFNTDAKAIARALRDDLGLDPPGATVLVLGAGGAGRVAALKLAAEGVRTLFLVNRTPSKAEKLSQELHDRFPKVKVTVGYPTRPVGLILNATSLGLKPDDPLPLDLAEFSINKARAVYDMVYRPAETDLLRKAKAAGCQTANGLGMLLYQGASALELWSGRQAPVDAMRRALVKDLYGH
jgi:shikimate dehydrogenase